MRNPTFCLLLLVLVFTASSAQATYVYFAASGAPKEGVDQVVYHTTVEAYPRANGYYWADQAVAISGLKPDSPDSDKLVKLSDKTAIVETGLGAKSKAVDPGEVPATAPTP